MAEPFWRNLPPPLQAAAEPFLPKRHPRLPGLRLLTVAEWDRDGRRSRPVEVGDPVYLTRDPDGWRAFVLYPEPPEYEFHLMRQAVATRGRWRWGIEPGRHAGGVVHLLANGPSAMDFPGAVPGETVVALNGARSLVRPDYWFIADSGYVGGPAWVARMIVLAMVDPTVPGILTPSSCPEVAEVLRETHWYLTANAPGPRSSRYYRHLVPEGVVLPSFASGRQTVVSALHFCWWLLGGSGEVHLWGADFGCAAPPTSLADYYAGAYASGGAELHVADEWFAHDGGWTSEELLAVSRMADATIAFLVDDGLRVVRHRRPGCGVGLRFAEEVSTVAAPLAAEACCL